MSDSVRDALVLAGANQEAAAIWAMRLASAARRVREKRARHESLPTDAAVLAEIEGGKPVCELGREARTAIITAAVAVIRERMAAPFNVGRDWLASDEAQARLVALDAETLSSLRRFAAASIRDERDRRRSWMTQNESWLGCRVTKRGQPPRFGDFDFACACYVAVLDACGITPGRTWDAYAGGPGGRFHGVLTAAMRAHGFGRDGYGADRLIREVLAWMAPDGTPDPEECEFVRNRWLRD